MARILLVEDDENLGISLEKTLTSEGFQVDWSKNLESAKESLTLDHQMVLLDWMLPDGQGIDFVKEQREKKNMIPILMLTARSELIDKVVGLEAGANDYLPKPFEVRELIARIRVQLRDRSLPQQKENPLLEHKDLKANLETREVWFKENKVEMTKMEFDLLTLFLQTPGRVFSREEILNKVWGYENFPSTRTVDTHIIQLRNKSDESYFETIRGIGYKIV